MTAPLRRPGRRLDWGSLSRHVVLLFFATVFAFPLVYMAMSSLKSPSQMAADSASIRAFLPTGDLSLRNYEIVFEVAPVGQFLVNSSFISGVVVLGGIVVNSLAAFAIARMRWRARRVLLAIIIATIILPFETIAVPLLFVASRLPTIGFEDSGLLIGQGWLNSYHVQIVPFVAQAFAIFLFVQYFRSLPAELDEAARMDGAGWFTIYRRIVMPLSGPVVATVAVLTFLPIWNSYLWPLMVTQTEGIRPVMVGAAYFGQWGPIGMAYMTLVTLPVLALFIVLQRRFLESIATTSMTG